MSYLIKRQTDTPPVRVNAYRDCPKCMFSMEALRNSPVLNRDYGYSLDSNQWCDPDNHALSSLLFGSITRFLYRNLVAPLANRWIGEWKNRRYRRLLEEYPRSLICTHCEYVLKQK